MANRAVTLMRYCKTPDGWRRYAAVIGKNGRVRPGFVTVKGRHHEYPEGHYEVRYYVGSKVAYLNVGNDAGMALNACRKHSRLLVARDTATAAGAVIVEEKGRVNLAKALTRFVQAAEERGSMVAAQDYRLAGEEFLGIVTSTFADQITEDDFSKYQSTLRKRGAADRTIFNRHIRVKSFLRFAGVDKKVFPKRAPRYEKTLPEIYTPEELESFFASLTDEQHVVTFKLAHQCGLREQELMHVQWPDLNLTKQTLHVRSKTEWGFKVKDKEDRLMPIPKGLVPLLSAFKEKSKGKLFITGTSGNKPNTHLLRMLKRLVRSADLHCGACASCIEHDECENWFLHKFRATYCTTLLRSGVDIRTVQKLMGHSDLASTMRYLRPAEDSELQAKVNLIEW
jgi:integrase